MLFSSCHHKSGEAYLKIKLEVETETRAPEPSSLRKGRERQVAPRKTSLEARGKVGGRSMSGSLVWRVLLWREGAEVPGDAE